MTTSSRLPLEVWGRRLMTRAEAWADRSRLRRYAYEFLWFGLKQGWACLFGGAMLALILGTFLFWPDQAPLARYDFLVLAAAIYVNFFAHHWLPDVRLALFAATGLLFMRGWFYFTADRTRRSMPLLLGYGLVALFIWFAENLGTFARAWVYPGQEGGWEMVSLNKLGAWFLLMIISVVLVSIVHRPEEEAG
ncbi:MAG TPA: hypothetical protein DCG71_05065 [Brevundimonas sp.]|nr:hypothetical protein [Brevundimonas sp.]